MRRAADRVESAIVVGLIVAFIVGAPLLALRACLSAYQSSLRAEKATAARHLITARLTADAPRTSALVGRAPQPKSEASARWTYAGRSYTGEIPVSANAPAGTAVVLWIDDIGRVVAPPRTHDQTTMRAIAAGPVTILGLACGLWLVRRLVRRACIRRQLPAWEADWAIAERLWTGRR